MSAEMDVTKKVDALRAALARQASFIASAPELLQRLSPDEFLRAALDSASGADEWLRGREATACNKGRKEGLVQGFADCKSLIVAMLESFATKETAGASAASGGSQETWHRARAGVLCEVALAVSLGQHQADTYDPDSVLAAHRRIINRSQASNAGRASAASKSQEERVKNGKRMAKARWDNARKK